MYFSGFSNNITSAYSNIKRKKKKLEFSKFKLEKDCGLGKILSLSSPVLKVLQISYITVAGEHNRGRNCVFFQNIIGETN